MDEILKELDLKIVHVGVNAGSVEAARTHVELLETLFGLPENPAKDDKDACFTGTQIEWMKGPGRGTHGHLAFSTPDLPKAWAYFEGKGVAFDVDHAKYAPDGTMTVLYASEELAGFAWHLLQR